LFAWESVKSTPKLIIRDIIKNINQIDSQIKIFAPKWPIDKINRVDLSILRLAIWELKYIKNTPNKVIIDEAVEIAKEYGNESSSSFVNAVLGSIIK
ncbi:transcription antitermination factor NusB, partial [Candidatus Shapirobacteria bacterium CG_4_10_14_3_um_filter_35_13]